MQRERRIQCLSKEKCWSVISEQVHYDQETPAMAIAHADKGLTHKYHDEIMKKHET